MIDSTVNAGVDPASRRARGSTHAAWAGSRAVADCDRERAALRQLRSPALAFYDPSKLALQGDRGAYRSHQQGTVPRRGRDRGATGSMGEGSRCAKHALPPTDALGSPSPCRGRRRTPIDVRQVANPGRGTSRISFTRRDRRREGGPAGVRPHASPRRVAIGSTPPTPGTGAHPSIGSGRADPPGPLMVTLRQARGNHERKAPSFTVGRSGGASWHDRS